jgi:hypothetical protein
MQRVAKGTRLESNVDPACGVSEGANDPNREGQGGRTALVADGGCRSNSSLCGRCRELPGGSRDVFNLHGKRRAQLSRI